VGGFGVILAFAITGLLLCPAGPPLGSVSTDGCIVAPWLGSGVQVVTGFGVSFINSGM